MQLSKKEIRINLHFSKNPLKNLYQTQKVVAENCAVLFTDGRQGVSLIHQG